MKGGWENKEVLRRGGDDDERWDVRNVEVLQSKTDINGSGFHHPSILPTFFFCQCHIGSLFLFFFFFPGKVVRVRDNSALPMNTLKVSARGWRVGAEEGRKEGRTPIRVSQFSFSCHNNLPPIFLHVKNTYENRFHLALSQKKNRNALLLLYNVRKGWMQSFFFLRTSKGTQTS